jgi:hypothetical protein
MSLQAVWPAIADIGEPFLAKGVKVYVEGQLQTASGRTREGRSASLADALMVMPRAVVICLETEQAAVVRTMISRSRRRCSAFPV